MTLPAQGDQPLEAEVSAALGALGDLVHIKAGPATASLKAKRAPTKPWAPLGARPRERVDASYIIYALGKLLDPHIA